MQQRTTDNSMPPEPLGAARYLARASLKTAAEALAQLVGPNAAARHMRALATLMETRGAR